MSPDSTSFIFTALNNPDTRWDFIGVILAAIALLITISPKICRWLRIYLDRRSLKKRLGAELYTQDDILRATKYYIKPNCQDVDPSQEEDIRAVHAVKNKLFETVDELLKNNSKFKYLIVLADSGMGKTAFVLNNMPGIVTAIFGNASLKLPWFLWASRTRIARFRKLRTNPIQFYSWMRLMKTPEPSRTIASGWQSCSTYAVTFARC